MTRWDTTLNLGKIHAHPELVVPILIDELSPTNRILATTISSLGSYGADAKEAVPELLSYVNDTNDYVRFETAEALKKIDPQAAEKAGIK